MSEEVVPLKKFKVRISFLLSPEQLKEWRSMINLHIAGKEAINEYDKNGVLISGVSQDIDNKLQKAHHGIARAIPATMVVIVDANGLLRQVEVE